MRVLLDAYNGLPRHGAYVNAATCALDLADAHLAADDMEAAANVAGKLFPVLGALRHEREARAALRIFCRAAEGRTLDVELVDEVRRRSPGARRAAHGSPG